MVAWGQLALEAGELVAMAEDVLSARRMKTLATIRRDGSPRLSEISGAFVREGDLWLGLIPSAKERDLDRDPRCAVHCGSPSDVSGASLRVSGRVIHGVPGDVERLGLARPDGEHTFSLYRLDLTEIVVTRPDPESRLILIEWWNAQGGLGRLTRRGG